MSTTPTTPSVSPGAASIFNTLSQYAILSAETIQQEQSDISQNNHAAAVTDGLTGLGAALATAKPGWTPDIQASLALAQTFVPFLVGLFHRKK